MRPSPVLCSRIPFTTKEVGRGFYRGNRTGAMGAHTEYGGYIIDWRNVRHFNVPNLENFTLTPFVARSINPRTGLPIGPDNAHFEPKKVDAVEYLKLWRTQNPNEYHEWRNEELQRRQAAAPQQAEAQPADQDDESIEVQQEQLYTPIQPRSGPAP